MKKFILTLAGCALLIPAFAQTISFSNSDSFPFSGTTRGIPAGDFTGDGKADFVLLTTVGFDGALTLYQGLGDGTVLDAVWSTSLSSATNVTSGDINGDGRLDLVVGRYAGITSYTNNGNGTFSLADNFFNTPGMLSYQALAVADFNRDGKMDVAAGVSNGVLLVYNGNGDGTFAAATNYAVVTEPRCLTAGDFNGDGWPDLAVGVFTNGADIRFNTNAANFYFNNGNGTFGNVTGLSMGSTLNPPQGLAAADFDGDGKLDLAVVIGSTTRIFRGIGDGTFEGSIGYGFGTVNCISSADFNGDARPDIVVPGSIRVNTTPAPPVVLKISPGASSMVVRWSAFGNNQFQLESATALSSTMITNDWTVISNGVATVGTEKVYTNLNLSGQQFFRLRK